MNPSLIFWLGCIPVRLALAYLGMQQHWLPFVSAVTLPMGLGLAAVYAFRLRPAAREGGGKPTWWDCLRPLHAALYLAAALYAYRGSTAAGAVLLADVLMGAGATFVVKDGGGCAE